MSTAVKVKGAALPATLAARADRIRVALARRDEQDAAIAKELRAAKDECGTEARWLKWCAKEFGWGRAQAFTRLSPARMQKDRERAAARRAKSGPSRLPDPPAPPRISTPSEREKHASLVVEMIREGFKALAKKHHPDVGGSGDHMALLAAARDWGVQFIENPPLINYGGR